ncbi:hypothetical protein BGZ46_001882, partial [Entomortierella lignicola]
PKRRFEDDEPDTSRKSPKYEAQITDSLVNTILQKIDERIPKRQHEDDGIDTPQKTHKLDDWIEYQAKDGPIDLPSALIELLNDDQYKPESRDSFRRAFDGKRAGDQISLPSFGQEPKGYGEGFQGKSFFITEQMMALWEEFSKDSKHSIKKVLAGPMGVGKSYLAIFLAARAYAEGWPVLYIADAAFLVRNDTCLTGAEICKRFFALNKDILTTADFKTILIASPRNPSRDEAAKNAASSILSSLLSQKNKKTLFIIDEHGKLFDKYQSYPNLLPSLTDIHAWEPVHKGARVIFTGTAHAGYELRILAGDISSILEFVGPLSDMIFDKLLESSPFLSKEGFREGAKEVTGNVPRELDELIKYLGPRVDRNHSTISDLIRSFWQRRQIHFKGITESYFHRLEPREKQNQLKTLAHMFKPDGSGFLDPTKIPTQPQFMDRGLVYRIQIGPDIKYRFLCPPAKYALLDFYIESPLPDDMALAIKDGNLESKGILFENALAHALLKYKKVILEATDLEGKPRSPLDFSWKSFDITTKTPSKVSEDVFRRCYKGYPRFDFIFNRTFIQVSTMSFADHDVGSKMISNAFTRPITEISESNGEAGCDEQENTMGDDHHESTKNPGVTKRKRKANGSKKNRVDAMDDSATDGEGVKSEEMETRNQIEIYLDSVFGGKHVAKINPATKHFEVSRDGVMLDDFRIVYLSGKPKPKRCIKFEEYPDLLLVDFNELKSKLFGDLVREQCLRG